MAMLGTSRERSDDIKGVGAGRFGSLCEGRGTNGSDEPFDLEALAAGAEENVLSLRDSLADPSIGS